jgi:hypothetical protein
LLRKLKAKNTFTFSPHLMIKFNPYVSDTGPRNTKCVANVARETKRVTHPWTKATKAKANDCKYRLLSISTSRVFVPSFKI